MAGYCKDGITLQDSVMRIGAEVMELPEEAFRERDDIREVEFAPESPLAVIPTGCFRGCSSLEKVRLPERLSTISAHAFAYCGKLKEIVFPEGVKRIGNNAFSRCESLGRVKLPDSVTELESYAFSDCFRLDSVRMPGNSSLLGELIFSGCEKLRVIEEPSAQPPAFDCSSFIFEPEEDALYRQCELKVRAESREAYRQAPGWHLFREITPLQAGDTK